MNREYDPHVGAHLTPLDAAFLELEQSDEAAHMHIGWAMIFDPLPDGGSAIARGSARARRRSGSSCCRVSSARLSSPRVGRLSLPTWEPDPDFDVVAHMRHATLPAPGGEAELLDWLGDFYSHRLDRARPLWETTLIDGLADGRWALASKVHHCLVDGISGASVTTVLLDAEPDPAPDSKGIAGLLAAAVTSGRSMSAACFRSSMARWAAASTPRCIRASSPRHSRGRGRWRRCWSAMS